MSNFLATHLIVIYTCLCITLRIALAYILVYVAYAYALDRIPAFVYFYTFMPSFTNAAAFVYIRLLISII
jgi:hypothetical protein